MTSSLFLHFLMFFVASTVQLPIRKKAKAFSGGVKSPSQMGDEFAAAMNAKDAQRAAALYAADAVVMPPNGEIIHGRTAIEASWKQLLEQGLSEVRSKSLDSGAAGDLAFETGTFELTIQVPGGPVIQDRGKYMNVLRRSRDGRWRTVYDMWNSSLPAK